MQTQRSWLSRKLRPKETQGGQPYVQFAAIDGNWLHMEASSNSFLAPENQLDQAATAVLERLGWSPPAVAGSGGLASPNYVIDRPLAEAPEVADLAVQTLVEVFGVADVTALEITQV